MLISEVVELKGETRSKAIENYGRGSHEMLMWIGVHAVWNVRISGRSGARLTNPPSPRFQLLYKEKRIC